MPVNPIILKLRKMKRLADGAAGTPEGRMAQTMLEKLIEKYKIDVEEIQERRQRKFDYGRHEFKAHARHLAFSLGLTVYRDNRAGMFIEANDEEWETFIYLITQVKDVFKEKQRELRRQLDSYMLGFMELTYPITDDGEEPKCPECGTSLTFVEEERRYRCACGYKGQKLRTRWVDEEERNRGRQHSGKLLK